LIKQFLSKISNSKNTYVGIGYDCDDYEKPIKIIYPDSYRSGQNWCFGTTRVGKTRLEEGIVEQDIEKNLDVIVFDPKGDIPLFSKIVSCAYKNNRQDDLMLLNPIFPEYSIALDPLYSFFLPEELVGHIMAGVGVGKDPFFFNAAYETSLVVVQGLLLKAEYEKKTHHDFNLEKIKNYISYSGLEDLAYSLKDIETNDSLRAINDLQQIINTGEDYFNRVASSLRVALTELTSGNVGKVLGRANENRLIERLENGKGVILVAQLGSLLTRKTAYTVGKVLLSMLQAFVGRCFSRGKKILPGLAIHLDEAQDIIYPGCEAMFAQAGGTNTFLHGYCQSVKQIHDVIGREKGDSILACCNTKIYMRAPDADTADYVSKHLGTAIRYSPIISSQGNLTLREVEELRVKPTEILNLKPREFFLTTYSGTYKGVTAEVSDPIVNVEYK
jgi:conjugal transfer pilus assembly protein TraD